jgi:hypothetical protein
MARVAVFAGLVIDENERPVSVVDIGGEAMYVVDDDGFHRHIASETVDRQVLTFMREAMEGHEDVISEQTAKMLGQDDLFTRAIILTQLKQMDQQFDTLMNTGIPEEGRAYLGMMGFRVVINVHGEVIRVDQPGMTSGGEDEGE